MGASKQEMKLVADAPVELVPATSSRFQSRHQPTVHTQLLSDGQHAVMMTVAGSVRVDDGLVLLLTPPFDDASIDAGYIRGYPRVSLGVSRMSVDEKELQTSDGRIPLADDAGHHRVEVVLG